MHTLAGVHFGQRVDASASEVDMKLSTTAPFGWYLACTAAWSAVVCMLVVAAGVVTGNTVDSTAPLALLTGLLMQYALVTRRLR